MVGLLWQSLISHPGGKAAPQDTLEEPCVFQSMAEFHATIVTCVVSQLHPGPERKKGNPYLVSQLGVLEKCFSTIATNPAIQKRLEKSVLGDCDVSFFMDALLEALSDLPDDQGLLISMFNGIKKCSPQKIKMVCDRLFQLSVPV
jgi:hypothetical protein